MAKYSIKPGYEKRVIRTSFPEKRKNGIYVLSECSQADLKYLHDVVNHPYIILEDVAKKAKEVSE